MLYIHLFTVKVMKVSILQQFKPLLLPFLKMSNAHNPHIKCFRGIYTMYIKLSKAHTFHNWNCKANISPPKAERPIRMTIGTLSVIEPQCKKHAVPRHAHRNNASVTCSLEPRVMDLDICMYTYICEHAYTHLCDGGF